MEQMDGVDNKLRHPTFRETRRFYSLSALIKRKWERKKKKETLKEEEESAGTEVFQLLTQLLPEKGGNHLLAIMTIVILEKRWKRPSRLRKFLPVFLLLLQKKKEEIFLNKIERQNKQAEFQDGQIIPLYPITLVPSSTAFRFLFYFYILVSPQVLCIHTYCIYTVYRENNRIASFTFFLFLQK